MQKTFLTLAALLIACLALGPIATGAERAGPRKIDSTLTAKYTEADPADPYGQSSFEGKVGPRKCAKNRKVTVTGFGSEKTDSRGRFSLTTDGSADPGKYTIKVAAKTIGKRGSETVCSRAKLTVRVR